MGRKTKLTPDLEAEIVGNVRKGLSNKAACRESARRRFIAGSSVARTKPRVTTKERVRQNPDGSVVKEIVTPTTATGSTAPTTVSDVEKALLR